MNFRQSRLLIVDDHAVNRDVLARRLERKGFVITTAENAHHLPARIERDNVDLVLLDIELPGITGLDALQEIRRSYSAVQLPVIIMVTAQNLSEDIVRAFELGANDYLTKPFDFPVALARIGTQLSHTRAEKALRESEERYALAARGANDGLWDWNLAQNTVYFSPRWKAMVGYEENEVGEGPNEWFGRIHEADRTQVQRRIAEHLTGSTPHFECEMRMLHKDGVFRWMLSRGVMVRDQSGNPMRMAGSLTDITEGKVADPLTGLPNRLLFLDRLSRLIDHRLQQSDALFGVLYLDLDGFKTINDSLGHLIGDKLLVEMAARLTKSLRSTDILVRMQAFTIARLGGDEFAILLDQLNQPEDAAKVAERLMRELTQPFELDGREVFTSVSIGIALSGPAYTQPEEMLRDADTAMYRAKSLGKARCELFNTHMRAALLSRLQLETDLRDALKRGEFINFYQPIISLETGRIVGFEALSRWQHPARGLLEPNEFIPVAEETGLIRELGWWNLREACRQISEWKGRGEDFANLTISVNLSVKQFQQSVLVEQIDALLQELSLPPNALKLELTEGCVMADPLAATNMLNRMKALGVQLAIDDFGTGFSSLSHLHRFPLDTLKIDRSFTSAMVEGGDDKGMIVRTIMPLAQNLGLDVVAEGVETNEQVALLKEMQCKYAQGFYFSKPLSAPEAEALLTTVWTTSPFNCFVSGRRKTG